MLVFILFLMWAIFKLFIESVTVLFLVHISVFFGLKACGLLLPPPGMESTLPTSEGEVLTTGPPGKSQFTFFKPNWLCCRFLEAHMSRKKSPPRLSHVMRPQGWHPFRHLGYHNTSDTDSNSLCGCVCNLVSMTITKQLFLPNGRSMDVNHILLGSALYSQMWRIVKV